MVITEKTVEDWNKILKISILNQIFIVSAYTAINNWNGVISAIRIMHDKLDIVMVPNQNI